MALPIAHATAGYLVHRAGRRVVAEGGGWRRPVVFMFIGNLPDMDFVVGFVIGQPGLLHRGVSHTWLAAVVFALAAAAFVRWRWHQRFGPAALLFGAAYLSHLLLDFLTMDTRPPAGGQFLWPLSSAYFVSPVTTFTEIYIDGTTRAGFLRTVLAWRSVVVLTREIVIAAIALGAWFAAEAWQARLAATRRPVLVVGAEEEDLA
jgi:membrane-bound metal-dependent hydrolase YbcI (DUF457 family)